MGVTLINYAKLHSSRVEVNDVSYIIVPVALLASLSWRGLAFVSRAKAPLAGWAPAAG